MKTIHLIILLSILTGCSLLAPDIDPPAVETYPLDENQIYAVDAKQRLIYSVKQGNSKVVCAEPSPDVFNAIDSRVASLYEGPSSSISVDRSKGESSAGLTDRTPTIQLLRDALYRVCEAYMNDLITTDDYRNILMSYDEISIALAAIDAIGRKPSAPLPSVSTNISDPISPIRTVEHGTSNLEDDSAKAIRGIVKDYYCLQLLSKGVTIDNKVVENMCKYNN